MLAERFTGMNVGQMHFDERDGDPRQRVTNGHTGMRERGGVNDDEADVFLWGGMNTLDKQVFGIALETLHRHADGVTLLLERGIDIGKGLMPVMLGLSYPQQVEIRSVQNKDLAFLRGHMLRRRLL